MSSLSLTSFVASSMSVPYSNSSVRMEMFSRELEVTSLRSWTPLREFSSTFVRLFSTSSAEAPGYEDITIITLDSISGNVSIGSRVRAKTPMMAKARNIKATVTGLLTEVL